MGERSLWSKILLTGSLVAVAVSTACGALPNLGASSADPADAQPAASGAPSSIDTPPVRATISPTSTTNSRQAVVKKDSITETVSLDGTVAADKEIPVTYSGSGKVQDIKVKVGQAVHAGDVLLELDAIELGRSLDAAQARLQTSKANLAQAQAQLAAQQRTSAQRAAAAQQQQLQSVSDGMSNLRRAQDNLAKVMAGPSDLDRQPLVAAIQVAQTALQKALAAQDKLTALPDNNTVRQAQNDVKNAQLAYDKAQQDYDTLIKGANPVALSAAQREVDRARTQLQLAQMAPIDPKAPDQNAAKIQHDSAIADAQLAVQTTQANLDKIQQPPADVDVQSAKLRLQNAKDTLDAATARWNQLAGPPDEGSQDAAQAAVDAAQQNLNVAQARLDALNGHPTAAEIADAQDQVRKAQASVDAARKPVQTDTDPGGVDLGALQQAIDQDQADVNSLSDQIQNARIVAPSSGTVLRVGAKPGDTITSAKPVLVLAPPGPPIVRVQLADDQATRVTTGLTANIVLDDPSASTASTTSPTPSTDSGTGAAPPISALVAKTTAGQQTSGGPTADLTVEWPDGKVPTYGVPVQVNVTLQKKADVLVIPKNAVHQAGTRTYVEVMDGTLRKVANIQVGITTDNSVEVVSGLAEGQVVLLTS